MKCSLCKCETNKITLCKIIGQSGNVVELNICDSCFSHIENDGKFIRVDTTTLNLNSFGDELTIAIGDWFIYKSQKGDTYTPKGTQTLITQIKNQVKATSEEVVIAKIKNSIENKWKGICWEDNSFLKPQILELFEKTWEIVVNIEGKEEAKRYYLYIFKTFSDIEKIKTFARQIYISYKHYVDNLSDEKYCKTFYRWLKAEVPTE